MSSAENEVAESTGTGTDPALEAAPTAAPKATTPKGSATPPSVIVLALITIVISAWGGIVPLVGPSFGFGADHIAAWQWSLPRGVLAAAPGAVGLVVGLVLLVAADRTAKGRGRSQLTVGGLVAVAAGAWFVIGPLVWPVVHPGVSYLATSTSATRRLGSKSGYSLGPGVILAACGAFALGWAIRSPRRREAVRPAPSVLAEAAEPALEPPPEPAPAPAPAPARVADQPRHPAPDQSLDAPSAPAADPPLDPSSVPAADPSEATTSADEPGEAPVAGELDDPIGGAAEAPVPEAPGSVRPLEPIAWAPAVIERPSTDPGAAEVSAPPAEPVADDTTPPVADGPPAKVKPPPVPESWWSTAPTSAPSNDAGEEQRQHDDDGSRWWSTEEADSPSRS